MTKLEITNDLEVIKYDDATVWITQYNSKNATNIIMTQEVAKELLRKLKVLLE